MSRSGNRNVARGVATREHVVYVAKGLFTARGYDETSVETVLQAAGVSRGALYHHFPGKEALFEAVLEAVEDDVSSRLIGAAARADDPISALRAGCLTWVELAGDPVVQRIVLLDAPAVLGWRRWREMDERHALGLLKAAVHAVAETGRLPPGMVDTFAHVLLATMNEIALMIARAPDTAAAASDAIVAVDEVLRRLFEPAADAVR